MSIVRYVYINNDTKEVLWGPGPMPYFITLKDGEMWEITAHTAEESKSKGIYLIEQVNYREIDPRLEQNNGAPIFSIVDDKPIETWSYTFVPSARINMIDAIDEHAELLRTIISTKHFGQIKEYDEAYNEAVKVAATPAKKSISEDSYPYLAADIGVTVSEITGNVVSDLREAADLVIHKRNIWKSFNSKLRKDRLLTKKMIREAADDAAAKLIYDDFTSRDFTYYL